MKIHSCAAPLFVSAFALLLPGQEPAGKTAPPAPQGPVLVVKTARMELAGTMAMGLELDGELPDLEDGAHWVLSLGADRKLTVATAKGDVGFVQASADPGGLMDLFAEQVAAGEPMLRGTLTLALQPHGFAAKDVAAFVKDLFQSPRQVQRLTLHVVGDPDAAAETGLDLTFGFEPKAGTTFAGVVEALEPCSQGVPVADGKDRGAIQMQGSLAPSSLRRLFAPMTGVIVAMTHQGEEERKAASALYERFLGIYDGGFSASFDMPMRGHMLFGTLDAAATQQMITSPEYLAMIKTQKMANREMQVEVTPDAFEHRGIKVMRSRVTSDGEPNPALVDGAMESYFAAAGSWFGGTLGGKEQDAKALFDLMLDGKVKRAPLPGGGLLRVAVDMHALVAALQEQMGGGSGPGDDMPAGMTLTIDKQDKALRVLLHFK